LQTPELTPKRIGENSSFQDYELEGCRKIIALLTPEACKNILLFHNLSGGGKTINPAPITDSMTENEYIYAKAMYQDVSWLHFGEEEADIEQIKSANIKNFFHAGQLVFETYLGADAIFFADIVKKQADGKAGCEMLNKRNSVSSKEFEKAIKLAIKAFWDNEQAESESKEKQSKIPHTPKLKYDLQLFASDTSGRFRTIRQGSGTNALTKINDRKTPALAK
jgi:hypothetical protein